jgi:Ti-type conjugative transfer relaxase TraA
MAIAFAQVTIHSRAKGHSAVAASAYRSATKIADERTGLTHDFTNRTDIIFTEVLIPEGVKQQFSKRDFLWNQLELSEKRKDSQLCKDIVLALPKELDSVSQIELAKRFAHIHFVSNGLPADISIHDGGDGNPHAHILVPFRRLEKEGFSKYKARDLNPGFAYEKVVEKDFLGQQWGEMQDAYFKENNLDLSVDLNHVIPEIHEGKIRDESQHYIKETNQLIRGARIELVLEQTDNLINQLSLEHSVFTKRDIEKLLFKTLVAPEQSQHFLQTVEKVLSHKNVIALGANDSGVESYTTRHQYVAESLLLKNVEQMQARNGHVFNSDVSILSRQYALNEEQSEALSYIATGNDLSLLIGRPGVGKSYMLKPLKAYYEANQCRVIGAALSGKVAKSLQNDTGIRSHTLASLTYQLTNRKMQLTKNDVIIIDEAGMVDFSSLSYLLDAANKAEAKVVLVGDPDQLKPIQKGEIFRGIAARTGYIELGQIRRQRDEGDRAASLSLAKGNVADALAHYSAKGAIHFSDYSRDATTQLVADWKGGIHAASDLKESVMFAFSRAAVLSLNEQAREALQNKGVIDKKEFVWQRTDDDSDKTIAINDKVIVRFRDKSLSLHPGDIARVSSLTSEALTLEVNGKSVNIPSSYLSQLSRVENSEIAISVGERVLFRKNDRDLGVRNGDMAFVEAVDEQFISARLDSGERVVIPNFYKHIDYGYATTVHKGQGMTVDDAKILIDSKYWDRNLSFVAMTRHRNNLFIYADRHQHPDMDALQETLSRTSTKDNVIDWPLDFAIRAGFDPDKMVGRALNRIAGVGHQIKNKWNYLVNYEAYLNAQEMDAKVNERQALRVVAKDIAGYFDEKLALCKHIASIKRAAKATGINEVGSTESEDVYNRRVAQNKRAFELVSTYGATLDKLNRHALDVDGLKKDSLRHERYLTIKGFAEQSANAKASPQLLEQVLKVDLSKDYAHIRHLALENNKPPKELYQQIASAQKLASQTTVTKDEVSTERLPVKAVLSRYVDMACEQVRLVDVMHSKTLMKQEGAPEAKAETIAHSKAIKAFAAEAIKNPEVQSGFEAIKQAKPPSLAERGGFVAIRDRISQGDWLKEDMHAVLLHLRGKAREHDLSQTQDRDRGGRKQ